MKLNSNVSTYFLNKGSLVCVFFATTFFSCESPPDDLRIRQLDPEQAKRVAAEVESLVNPELDESLTLQLWASDSLVYDPISIDFDEQGRLYYSRTIRQKNSEFDIRRHQDWEIESISLQSIEEKRAFLRKVLAPEHSDKNQWLKDVNGDGSHDWRDMTVEKERIYRLEDTNRDGLADKYQLVVEDFNDEVTDVAGAVMKHGDDLFLGVGPDMWRIKEHPKYGLAQQKESISHGYGIHVGFSGHGMSGLEMGPDGRVYWGIGDIGFNGKGPDGKEWKYPNRGVIARSNPDGSDFEIFAMGVRNTHEFVFDEFGNLISVDNDGDHRGERERLVYLVDGSDTGWRTNWQFGKYRDPDNNTYKIWMDENMHTPQSDDKAAYFIPPIINYVNGPTGMLYNPGTALSPAWKNTFFVAEFVGNPARSGIHAFKLAPKGAGFELAETKKIMGGILATGMDFGPDGSLYFSDWIDGWGTKDAGRIWKVDDKAGDRWVAKKETAELIGQDFTEFQLDRLSELLGHEDQRIRQKAQFALVDKGAAGLKILEQQLAQRENRMARVHAIWGIAQMARSGKADASVLIPILKDSDDEIRAQAARWLGDLRFQPAGEAIMPLLTDSFARARFFAAEALGRIAYEPAIQSLVTLLEENDGQDVYLRHAGSLALARIGKAEPIIALSTHDSKAVRTAAVVALRRMEHPGVSVFLKDTDEYVVAEAARAINDDFSIPEALPDLGNVLRETSFTSEPLIRRAINANLRVGTTEAMKNLIDYANSVAAPTAMRVEALNALSTWAKPSVLDRVDGRNRGTVERNPKEVRMASSAVLMNLLETGEEAIRISAAQAIGKLQIVEAAERLYALLEKDPQPNVREASLRSLAAINWEGNDRAIQRALTDKDKNVRVAGLALLENLNVSADLMADLLADVIEKQTLEERQAALITLGKVPVDYSGPVFHKLLDKLAGNDLSPEIELELGEALQSSGSQELQSRYAAIQEKLTPDQLLTSYRGSMYGGDERRGRSIFFQHQTAQCIRCHAYNDFGGNAGPRMNGVGKLLSRDQLLEALVEPSKRLAPGFGVVTLTLNDGETISGVLEKETNSSLFIKMGNNPDKEIRKDQIKERKDAPSSMPDMKGLLTRREIRDVVSFLATLTEDDH
ncbi:HEAT repeat domain-containing protein [Lunatimonas salinarum]|uniref:HEAT repeat domain-containing protein n=1 Tax=Lunatimonas salinarum TaxID=1774590 RepID=UPI001AE09F34|nr:HEAT repeat domain-containing protein [Lunatimonas salinarum]